MSLRITLEIVPFGEESEKRPIGTVTISRMSVRDNPCDYKVRREVSGKPVQEVVLEDHYYQDGAWELARRAIEVLEGVGV
jgi:hypothetical protein